MEDAVYSAESDKQAALERSIQEQRQSKSDTEAELKDALKQQRKEAERAELGTFNYVISDAIELSKYWKGVADEAIDTIEELDRSIQEDEKELSELLYGDGEDEYPYCGEDEDDIELQVEIKNRGLYAELLALEETMELALRVEFLRGCQVAGADPAAVRSRPSDIPSDAYKQLEATLTALTGTLPVVLDSQYEEAERRVFEIIPDMLRALEVFDSHLIPSLPYGTVGYWLVEKAKSTCKPGSLSVPLSQHYGLSGAVRDQVKDGILGAARTAKKAWKNFSKAG